jgi:hypothetical protein
MVSLIGSGRDKERVERKWEKEEEVEERSHEEWMRRREKGRSE